MWNLIKFQIGFEPLSYVVLHQIWSDLISWRLTSVRAVCRQESQKTVIKVKSSSCHPEVLDKICSTEVVHGTLPPLLALLLHHTPLLRSQPSLHNKPWLQICISFSPSSFLPKPASNIRLHPLHNQNLKIEPCTLTSAASVSLFTSAHGGVMLFFCTSESRQRRDQLAPQPNFNRQSEHPP